MPSEDITKKTSRTSNKSIEENEKKSNPKETKRNNTLNKKEKSTEKKTKINKSTIKSQKKEENTKISSSKNMSLKDEKDITIKKTRKKSKKNEISQKLSEADTIKASKIILEEIKEFNIKKSEEEKEEKQRKIEDENNAKENEENEEIFEDNLLNSNETLDLNSENKNGTNFKSNGDKSFESSEDEERKKLKEIHTELVTIKNKKDSRLKNKFSEIFRNLLVAIMIVLYFMLIMFENANLPITKEMTYLKISSIVCLIGGIILFENSFYKDKESLFLNAIEITSLGICTLYLLNIVIKQSINFNFCIAVMIAIYVAYYIIKAIFIRIKKEEIKNKDLL